MSINWPYEVFAGSDVLAFSFELPEALVAVSIEGDWVPSLPQTEMSIYRNTVTSHSKDDS
jgi:hypothetical protein